MIKSAKSLGTSNTN